MPTAPLGDVPSLPRHIFRMPKLMLVVQAMSSLEAGGITRGQSISFMQKKKKNLLALLCLLFFIFLFFLMGHKAAHLLFTNLC